LSGIAGGRLVGIFIDGSPNPLIIALLAAEFLFAASLTVPEAANSAHSGGSDNGRVCECQSAD
jgi:hypothetical protein